MIIEPRYTYGKSGTLAACTSENFIIRSVNIFVSKISDLGRYSNHRLFLISIISLLLSLDSTFCQFVFELLSSFYFEMKLPLKEKLFFTLLKHFIELFLFFSFLYYEMIHNFKKNSYIYHSTVFY